MRVPITISFRSKWRMGDSERVLRSRQNSFFIYRLKPNCHIFTY